MSDIKKIIVTGGAQGIGSEIVLVLYSEGYQLVVFDKDEEAISEKRKEFPNVDYQSVDLSSETEIVKVFQLLDLSNLGALINNAAISANKPIANLSTKEWNKVLSVNLTAPLILSKLCSPFLAKNNGAIVNIASTRALMSEPHTEAYSASKGGLLALTHALAMSLGPHVRVNAISPGWIEVGDLQKESARSEVKHSREDQIQHPVGRVGHAKDIAEMVSFLISEKAGFITGQNFVIDGGMTKKMIYV